MLLLQHVLCAIYKNTNLENKDYLAAIMFPDAIRFYTKQREYSHFEENYNNTDVSYMYYPNTMKNISEESLLVDAHLAKTKSAIIGEKTNLDIFKKYNSKLPQSMYKGIYNHLIQDIIFDDFVRQKFDCSRKYEDIFIYKNSMNEEFIQKLNGVNFKKLLAEIEEFGIYILAYLFSINRNLCINRDWINEKILPILYEEYDKELADNTAKYLNQTDKINYWISSADWTHLDEYIVSYKEYVDLYSEIFNKMI